MAPDDTDQFRLLDGPEEEACLNMAVDEAVSRAVGDRRAPPTVRFYTWSRPAISIGAFQPVREVDLERCKKDNIQVVRRITGGRALLHQQELTYSVIFPSPSPYFPSNLQGCCRAIAEALQLGFNRIGLAVEIVPAAARPSSKLRPPDCFSMPSLYELTAGGRKLVGSAQRRWLKMFLQHGSIPIETDRTPEMKLIIGSNGDAVRKAVRLSELLNPLPSIENLKNALRFGFEKRLGITLRKGGLTSMEDDLAQELVRTRYAQEAWTHRK